MRGFDLRKAENASVFFRRHAMFLFSSRTAIAGAIINCSQMKFVAIVLVLSVFLRLEEEYWSLF